MKSARASKIQRAVEHLPQLGEKRKSEDEAVEKGYNVCTAMYLYRRKTAVFSKERLKLRIYDERQVEPSHQSWQKNRLNERVSVEQCGLGSPFFVLF